MSRQKASTLSIDTENIDSKRDEIHSVLPLHIRMFTGSFKWMANALARAYHRAGIMRKFTFYSTRGGRRQDAYGLLYFLFSVLTERCSKLRRRGCSLRDDPLMAAGRERDGDLISSMGWWWTLCALEGRLVLHIRVVLFCGVPVGSAEELGLLLEKIPLLDVLALPNDGLTFWHTT